MAFTVMAYIVVACLVMACIVIACIVLVMAYIVMAVEKVSVDADARDAAVVGRIDALEAARRDGAGDESLQKLSAEVPTAAITILGHNYIGP